MVLGEKDFNLNEIENSMTHHLSKFKISASFFLHEISGNIGRFCLKEKCTAVNWQYLLFILFIVLNLPFWRGVKLQSELVVSTLGFPEWKGFLFQVNIVQAELMTVINCPLLICYLFSDKFLTIFWPINEIFNNYQSFFRLNFRRFFAIIHPLMLFNVQLNALFLFPILLNQSTNYLQVEVHVFVVFYF